MHGMHTYRRRYGRRCSRRWTGSGGCQSELEDGKAREAKQECGPQGLGVKFMWGCGIAPLSLSGNDIYIYIYIYCLASQELKEERDCRFQIAMELQQEINERDEKVQKEMRKQMDGVLLPRRNARGW